MNYNSILITGGAGFIGSNFVEFLLKDLGLKVPITVVDSLSYCGNIENLKFAEEYPNFKFIKQDICNKAKMDEICYFNRVDLIVNFAAETHVDRSIWDATPFLINNVFGTLTMLEVAKMRKVRRFVQISTDEVYGSLNDSEPGFTEQHLIQTNSPYSASKASADNFVQAYNSTYGLDTVITRCSNNYGPRQFPEKLIPLLIMNTAEDKEIPIYGDGKNVRDWIYVKDHCKGIYQAIQNGKSGEVYNLGGECEKRNIEIAKLIISKLGRSVDLIKYVTDRPGHDWRYSMDISKAKRELGWHPETSFEDGIDKTIHWYLNNKQWCDSVQSEEYKKYYEKQYGARK